MSTSTATTTTTTTIASLASLNATQKIALRRANIKTVGELFNVVPSNLARRTKVASSDVQLILDAVCGEIAPAPRRMSELVAESTTFTTGDAALDAALGGGFRTGLVWDVAGESASGKSQLALQLSLTVQLPPAVGGLAGSACYLSVGSRLSTTRLTQILSSRSCFSSSDCSLLAIHNLDVPSLPELLLRVLTEALPGLMRDLQSAGKRPIRLLVLDSLTPLFRGQDKTTSQSLFDRGRLLTEISMQLHALASTHNMAVVVLNDVTDTFERQESGSDDELEYRHQSKWFNTGDRAAERRKEAGLGLVWANQVNVRLMMSRTSQRQMLPAQYEDPVLGKRKEPPSAEPLQETVVRRISVIFSPFTSSKSVEYIVTNSGLWALPGAIPGENSSGGGSSSSEHVNKVQKINHRAETTGEIIPSTFPDEHGI